ncbi:MAG: DNA integrity scanning diadenylate cyclase DisA [Acidimicrobiales bacterium]
MLRTKAMDDALGLVAPGQPLREGLDRILQANKGALIVVGDGPEVLSICSGGFLVDAEFTPQRLSELAKMDGAIILTANMTRIARANVHLVPDPAVPTTETGTRHRTAERVARSIDVPVISVSEDMSIIAVYRNGSKHQLESTPRLVNRANQALQTLERYKESLDSVSGSLSALEVEDLVTVRDVATVLQRLEMVRRIAAEIDGYLIELGEAGRLIGLQAHEMLAGVQEGRGLVIRDYLRPERGWQFDQADEQLASLSTEALLELKKVAGILRSGVVEEELDSGVQPRGYRLLSRVPRLPDAVIERIVDRFSSLAKVMRATVEELDGVSGVGEVRARLVKDGLSRLAESSILDRYS